ncbi:efflux RND transporter periplasmic adaptor subunit [Actinoplanes sp. NPDC049265]|uniref:efflux RND transporter periplasmic adaptor subunit n=1 Tax=Actinoplanes sp. NPDC049265 TaxID=3363902 RepID=UPI0037238581
MSRHPRRTFALITAAILLPTLTAASCGDEPSGVGLGIAARGSVAEIVEAPGSVTARAAATVTSPAEGTLADLRVTPGQRVDKGTVLAVIDSPAVADRLADAERGLNAAPSISTGNYVTAGTSTDQRAGKAFDAAREAAAKVTDTDVRAALLAQIDAAEQQYDAASAAAARAVRSVQEGLAGLQRALGALTAAQQLQAKQAYDLAVAADDALTLRAPVAGVVQLGGAPAASGGSLTDLLSAGGATTGQAGATGGLPAAPAAAAPAGADPAIPEGGPVSPGTPIVTVVDVSRLGLTAEVDETDILLVKPGGTATVELDAATGADYRATVRSIDQLPTTSARGGVSYRVRLDLGQGTAEGGGVAPTPRPGMSAVVRLRVREADDAVTVPASAVVDADGKSTVWAVRGGKAERASVTLGVQGEDVVQVTTGLDDGQRIVVSGADQVRAGQELP